MTLTEAEEVREDYIAVIDNMKLKSDIYREEKKVQQVLMMMEVVFE